jgi:hypothetical protein
VISGARAASSAQVPQASVPATAAEIEPWVTPDQRKRASYADDPYFWEGWAAFAAACGGQPRASALERLTFLMIKPEAIVGRRIEPVLDFLSSRGFLITGTWPVSMSRHVARALWRYQINVVPVAHLRALELGVTSGELFVVGLIHPGPMEGAGSAAELLRWAKGSSSAPAGDSLRDVLHGHARMLSFVHAPDEPADVIRELPILCEPGQLDQVMTRLVTAAAWPDARCEAEARAARLTMTARYRQVPEHDLDTSATFRRMRGCLRGSGGLPEVARAAIETGRTTPEQALEVVAALEAATWLPLWDRIVTAAHLTDGLRNGRAMLLTPPPAAKAFR